MKLYFLRHGLAGTYGDPRYKDDSLRPLTAQGRQKMRDVALGMQALGLKFDALLSSPYLRARQTAKIVAQAYTIKDKKLYFTNNLLPPASIKDLLAETHAHFPRSGDILFVGHEPHLTQMICQLLGCGNPLSIDLKKGGLCCLKVKKDLKQPDATFLWLLTPAQLVLIGLDLK